MEKDAKRLIDWKTNAWKKKEMASWYATQMENSLPTIQLKNLIEIDLIESYVAGSKVLDVGIGTGRASIPLLKKGLDITGVDSSQSMLDQCRIKAQNYPIKLIVGDLSKLPLKEERFNSIISLNVLTHFPHWQKVLDEWRRFLLPKGRIIFDIYSADNLDFRSDETVSSPESFEGNESNFSMHLKRDEIFEFADANEMRVVAIIPYGAIFSSGLKRHDGAKILNGLGWMKNFIDSNKNDSDLFNSLIYLEKNLFQKLSTRSTERFMVVLENNAHTFRNSTEKQRMIKIENTLNSCLDLNELSEALSINAEDWREKFIKLIGDSKSRMLSYYLITTLANNADKINFNSFFGDKYGAEADKWLTNEKNNINLDAELDSIPKEFSRTLVRRLSSWTAEVYGAGAFFRRYGVYPKWLPLCISTDHGPRERLPSQEELNSPYAIQMYQSPKNVKHWKKISNKPCYCFVSPFQYFRNKNNLTIDSNSKGTIAFLGHTTTAIDDVFDIDNYIGQLKNLPDIYHPISICVHMHDIHKAAHKKFILEGFDVYSAGHVDDPKYIENFYSIIRRFKYGTSNSFGSYIFYCVEMGIPFSIIGEQQILINNLDKSIPTGKYNPSDFCSHYAEAKSLFLGLHSSINEEQREYVISNLGVYDTVSRLHMTCLLYYALIRWVLSKNFINMALAQFSKRLLNLKVVQNKSSKFYTFLLK